MPLVLSLKENDDFYVEHDQFVVTRLYNETSFTLQDAKRGRAYEITEKEAVEIMPDVYVSAGDLFQRGIVRAVIDAPRSKLILRGEKYRASPPNGAKHEQHTELPDQ